MQKINKPKKKRRKKKKKKRRRKPPPKNTTTITTTTNNNKAGKQASKQTNKNKKQKQNTNTTDKHIPFCRKYEYHLAPTLIYNNNNNNNNKLSKFKRRPVLLNLEAPTISIHEATRVCSTTITNTEQLKCLQSPLSSLQCRKCRDWCFRRS